MQITQYRMAVAALFAAGLAACGSSPPTVTTSNNNSGGPFLNSPCSLTGVVSLAQNQSALADCSNGGSVVTLAGGGASYLIVSQLATNLVANNPILYNIRTGTIGTPTATPSTSLSTRLALSRKQSMGATGVLPAQRPMAQQSALERTIFSPARLSRMVPVSAPAARRSAALMTPPTLGSTRSFRVLSNPNTNGFSTITASLAYLGANVYIYIDNNAPAAGFTGSQLNAFGVLIDQTLYDIDINAFGQPSDIDGNGHVIMVMSPLVNGDSPAAQCSTLGYIAGFFDPTDFDGASDVNSNQGEVFYTIVPDPSGVFSCAHTIASLGDDIGATFLHELQHIINYSQHVVVHHQQQPSSWLDEGMSIAAEELGSLYYEQKCPPPACRSTPTQVFPDSSQGYVRGFLYDFYQYALLPDTVSLTLHDDSQDGFSWRGGDWALVRYLSDRFGTGFLQALETGPADGIADINAASGQNFTSLFADFGTALYTDSFPGLPRATAPANLRFGSRNARLLWSREFATSGGASTVPSAMPLDLFALTNDTSTFVLNPGAMSYWRLDTAPGDVSVSVRFARPDGTSLSAAFRPQMAIYRLPAGQ